MSALGMFGQAGGVEAGWLHQAWIFGAVIISALLGPAVAVWAATRRQRREVVEGDAYVTRSACSLQRSGAHAEVESVRRDLVALQGRLDAVTQSFTREVRDLRRDLADTLAGVRADVQMLVKAVGKLEGRVEERED